MHLASTTILGIKVTRSSKKEILGFIRTHQRPLVIATPNPEQIVLAQKNAHFANLLNQSDVAIPDGIGLAWVAGVPRVPGVEFMEDLVTMAAAQGFPVALIGGRGGAAAAALECLRRRYPGLAGWVEDPGDFDLGNLGDLGNLREKIKKTNTRLVFVGLGAPKQELFIEKLTHSPIHPFTHPLVLMSVGGSFDIIAGRIKRAPWIVRGMGFEWLWRLVRQPWRLRRQLALLKFLWLLAIKG